MKQMTAPRLVIKGSLWGCALLVPLGAAAPASAQALQQSDPQPNVETSAELYRSGLVLERRARYGEACHKFAVSRQLAPTLENTLEMAQCHKQHGRRVAASKLYRAGISLAQARGDLKAERSAREAVGALEPELARLEIDLSHARAQRVQIFRNGVPVPPELLGQPMLLDTGEHIIQATAPGKTPWSTHVDLRASSSKRVVVPLLRDAPNGARPASTRRTSIFVAAGYLRPVQESDSAGSWNIGKTFAVAAGTIGLAGTTWAVVHAVAFQNKKAEHERLQSVVNGCGDAADPCEVGSPRYQRAADAYAEARTVREDASRALYRSVAGAMVAGSGFAAGAMLWFTIGQQHSESRAALRVQPLAGTRLTGMSISGSW